MKGMDMKAKNADTTSSSSKPKPKPSPASKKPISKPARDSMAGMDHGAMPGMKKP